MKPVRGSPEFRAHYQGATFYFVTEAHRDSFVEIQTSMPRSMAAMRLRYGHRVQGSDRSGSLHRRRRPVVPELQWYHLMVRATDGTGRLQSSIEQDPAPDGAIGLHEVTVTVEI